ncbi:MAG: vWA domain-containing protein, partial [Chloroflexota bacterium]
YVIFSILTLSMFISVKPASASLVSRTITDDVQPPGSCYSLDVIFVLDQSASMGYDENGQMVGYAGSAPSDPLKQRKFAVEDVIDRLSDLALDFCKGTFHRIAVVSFGDNAQVNLTLSSIAPIDFQDSLRVREELKKKVEIYNLGQTQPKLAFVKVDEIMKQADPPPTGGPRKRVIIFITDGVPYPVTDSSGYLKEMSGYINTTFPFSPKVINLEACFNDLRKTYRDLKDAPPERKNKCLSDNKVTQEDYDQSVYMWTILLESKQKYPTEIINTLTDVSEKHGGQLIKLVQNRNEIPKTIKDIIERLSGVPSTAVRCGNFAVNPFLRKAILVFFKIDPELKVTLSYVNKEGKEYTTTGGQAGSNSGFDVAEYKAYGANERYVFNYPYAGIWKLKSDDCEGLDAYYDTVKVRMPSSPNSQELLGIPSVIPQVENPPYFDPQNENRLKYKLIDIENKELEQNDRSEVGLNINADVSGPEGTASKTQNLEMVWSPESKLFQSSKPIEVPLPGIYTVNIKGGYKEHTGEPTENISDDYNAVFNTPRELFRQEDIKFEVTEVIPIQIAITEPTTDNEFKPIHGTLQESKIGFPIKLPIKPITVKAQVQYKDGKPVEQLDTVLNDVNNAFNNAKIIDPDGNEVNVDLKPEIGNPGTYSATVTGLEKPGNYILNVALISQANRGYRILENKDKAEIPFILKEGDAWHTPFPYYTIMAAIVALFLLWILYNILIRTNKVRGTLQFIDGTDVLGEYPLYSGKSWKIIKGLERSCPPSGLRRVKVTNLRSGSHKGKNDEDLLSGDVGSSNGPSVHMEYITLSGRRAKIDLQPEMPQVYDDAALTEVLYKAP